MCVCEEREHSVVEAAHSSHFLQASVCNRARFEAPQDGHTNSDDLKVLGDATDRCVLTENPTAFYASYELIYIHSFWYRVCSVSVYVHAASLPLISLRSPFTPSVLVYHRKCLIPPAMLPIRYVRKFNAVAVYTSFSHVCSFTNKTNRSPHHTVVFCATWTASPILSFSARCTRSCTRSRSARCTSTCTPPARCQRRRASTSPS